MSSQKRCRECDQLVTGRHYCHQLRRNVEFDDDGFLLSLAVGAATNDPLVGAAVGGSFAGGFVGASMNDGGSSGSFDSGGGDSCGGDD